MNGLISVFDKFSYPIVIRLLLNVETLFQPSVAFYIETSHLIYYTNQMTDVCIKYNTGLKLVNKF